MGGELQQSALGCNFMDMPHKRASNASPRRISRYEEVIDVARLLEIGVAGYPTFNGRNERTQGDDLVCPPLLVVGRGCPGIELFLGIEVAGKCVDRRHEYASKFCLLARNEFANVHGLLANA